MGKSYSKNMSVEAAVTAMAGGSLAAFSTASKTATTLLSNIVKNPDEQKFRTIHSSNKAIQSRLLSHSGAGDFLLAVGFVQVDDTFVFLSDDTAAITAGLARLQAAQPVGEPAQAMQNVTNQPTVNESDARALRKRQEEMREKKRKDEAEKAALRARMASQRKEQEHHVIRESKAVLLKGRTKGTSQSATQMGCDGSADG